MVFDRSTQCKSWIFTKEQLFELRKKANASSKLQLQSYLTEEEMTLCINEDEELKVVNLFLNMIRHFYRKFVPPLPIQVFGVSVTYFRRFFLKHSVMDFHPREIIVTAIYIACKVLEFSISMDIFIKNIPKNSEKYHSYIYNSELFLMDQLNYDLWIYTPYEPFKAYMVSFRSFWIEKVSSRDVNDTDKNLINDTVLNQEFNENILIGYNNINNWYETDLMMIFAPDHVALAAVEASIGDKEHLFKEFLYICVAKSDLNIIERITDVLNQIRDFIKMETIVSGVDNLKHFENRIDVCRNPKYNPQSEVYQLLKMEHDEKFNSFD